MCSLGCFSSVFMDLNAHVLSDLSGSRGFLCWVQMKLLVKL